jgi:hypothetical protein
MQKSKDLKTPSPKVGIALILVVLVVVTVIFGSKFKFDVPVKDLENVELVLERKTGDNFKSGDGDEDGLPDWLEEFYKSDPNNPDTDGDGTNDGDEIKEKRDPTIAGPDDAFPLQKDLISEIDMAVFKANSLTDKTSIELFSQYLNLKKQGLLKPEEGAQMIEQISKNAVEQASLKPIYFKENLNIVPSTKESISAYGERLAQIALGHYTTMESYKNIKDISYFSKISQEYKKYGENASVISVPDVFIDAHIALINQLNNTAVFFDSIAKGEQDPVTAMVISAQYQATEIGEADVYTTLSNYFKNNAIIFDTDSTHNFWIKFQN